MASPPGSPPPVRPASMMMRPPRASSRNRADSRMSMTSKAGGSRASDEDGKTSVRVAIRVRPPLKPTDPNFDLIPQRFQESIVQVTSSTNLTIDSPQGKKLFVFDRVFDQDVSQEGVWDYLVESTASFVQGYNVSMLAYGQSGAGKSYTMGTSGPEDQEDMEIMGVIPRAGAALFEKLGGGPPPSNRNSIMGLRAPVRYSTSTPLSPPHTEKSWSLKATYVEIYNESLRDLLVPESTPASERPAVTIREDTKGHILPVGLHSIEICSVEDLMAALNYGSMIRQTDSTAINAKSSRSHAVFTLNLVQRKSKLQMGTGAEKRFSVPLEAMTGADTMVTVDSKFHFVDLAGSERLKNTGAMGDRAKEGISINAGLASLGKVISQLSSRQAGAHVSYRDSKLTRLLQDSLGGNAITYMIACVTPAAFHLSETLNTVQYAQRARAIQSKPRIQQTSDETDKQALIDRLKAEVTFLREQIRSTERGGDRRSQTSTSIERSERQGERERELQNQLLDTQENYTALSQRHAKLISELAKARDGEVAENNAHESTLGESATERLKRSHSFAATVDQVIIEYEKTIQSLEHSLSRTRTTLSSTETALLEKESLCAYSETMNQQLQARVEKIVEREANTEQYLHDLEAKLNGHHSGEDKQAAAISKLRAELARVRETEAACEDYISTLEERLAEADQEIESTQREIERLGGIIERQRNINKLDNLLYDLDHAQKGTADAQSVAGKRAMYESPSKTQRDIILESDEDDFVNSGSFGSVDVDGPIEDGEPIEPDDVLNENRHVQSPSQAKCMADKLETVTHELFELRVEHETLVNENHLKQIQFEDSARTIRELQDALDEARHRSPNFNRDSMSSVTSPTRPAFLASARVSELRDGAQLTSSRSLSSELSSAGEFATSVTDPSDADAALRTLESRSSTIDAHNETVAELESWRKLVEEKELAQRELAEKYAKLEAAHEDTMDLVEELKTEVSKAKMAETSGTRSPTPVIRRKSSQNVMIIDRAHRSFASLRNIATENFEGNPDVMANFELNLNTAMHELHTRSERVQELEADISAVKKQMDDKMTLLSGLTRERSSLKSSPLDISVVSQIQNQLAESTSQMKRLQDSHETREKVLLAEIDQLRTMDGQGAANNEKYLTQESIISEMQTELSAWEAKHQAVLSSMQSSEEKLLATISDLESRLADATGADAQGQDAISLLQKEIDEHKATVGANAERLVELDQSHASTLEQLNGTAARLESHKAIVARMEVQIAEHENVIKAHQDGLNLLQENHTREVEETKLAAQADREASMAELESKHQEASNALDKELAEARDELTQVCTQVALALGVDVSTEKLQERINELITDRQTLSTEQKKSAELAALHSSMVKELESVKMELSALVYETAEGSRFRAEHATVSDQLAALRKEMANLETKNKKNSRLVEELEEQLAQNFDSHQLANNRLSNLQTERNSQVDEAIAGQARAQAELDAIKEEYAVLRAKFEDVQAVDNQNNQRSNSALGSNNIRIHKSSSVASLPSPPPAIPLPALPGSIGAAVSPGAPPSGPVPQTPTKNQFRESNSNNIKDGALSQIQEDQEARIRTIVKHLDAEKQLTSTLEEALTDLERQSNKMKSDCDAWRRRAGDLESELKDAKEREKSINGAAKEHRWSMQQIEEEKRKRREAEDARTRLEERMNALATKKKKKGSLSCF